MSTIQVLIADDEPLSREGLRLRLAEQSDIQVVAECANGQQVLDTLQTTRPNVLFLDIEMPGINGIELAEQLNKQGMQECLIVFVTAFRDFALRAFELQAFDYLLKPISTERMDACLNKLRGALQQSKACQREAEVSSLLSSKTGQSLDGFIRTLQASELTGLAGARPVISLKSGNDWLRIPIDTILWIEAAGDYMCVHTKDGNHIVRTTLKELVHSLDAEQFVRVSRFAIVNLAQVNRLAPNANGEYIASLYCGVTLKVGRKYKLQLDELANKQGGEGK